jgi:protein-tyrosine phosphatase
LPPKTRDLTWDGCLNVRDLGGFPTADGDKTRFGSVVRADSVSQLTQAGWEALVEYGVRTVLDLRGDHEREDDPPRELPIEVLHIPFMEASDEEWNELAERLDALYPLPVADATREAYLLFLEEFKPNVGAAFKTLVNAPKGGVVVHCVGGKDRTGLLTALLLHVAGVPIEAIAEDYAVSEERLRPRHEGWFEAPADDEEELERLRRISQCPPEAIIGVFEEVERRYGSVENYLRSTGVTDDEVELARRRLL